MKLKLLLGAGLVATTVATPAIAAFINGGIGFSDGFDTTGTTTSIVSQLTAVDVQNGATTLAQGCTGDFTPPACAILGAFANDFNLSGGAQNVYQYGGFTFQVTLFGSPNRTSLTCSNGLCQDALQFIALGIVSGNGFQPTAFLMGWGATGNCVESTTTAGQCGSQVVGTWQSTITATGHAQIVPEPGTIALLGLALGLLGIIARRRKV